MDLEALLERTLLQLLLQSLDDAATMFWTMSLSEKYLASPPGPCQCPVCDSAISVPVSSSMNIDITGLPTEMR
jgi:hypothetical protein